MNRTARPNRRHAADAAFHGAAVGAGRAAGLLCDMVIAARRARIIAGRLGLAWPAAIRFTQYTLNNLLRASSPIFDASLVLE